MNLKFEDVKSTLKHKSKKIRKESNGNKKSKARKGSVGLFRFNVDKPHLEKVNDFKTKGWKATLNLLKKINLNIIILIVFICFGIVFLVNDIVNIVEFVDFQNEYKGYVRTKGVETRLHYGVEDGQEVISKVYTYTVDGKKYEVMQKVQGDETPHQNREKIIYYKKTNVQNAKVPYKTNHMVYIVSYSVMLVADVVICYLYYKLRLKKEETPQEQMSKLDKNFEKVLSSIETSNDKLFKTKEKRPNEEKFTQVDRFANVYELKIKDSNGNVVGKISDSSKSPSMAEDTKINTKSIEEQIMNKLQDNQNVKE